MSSAPKYSDRFKAEKEKEKEKAKEPAVSTKSFADFPSLGRANVVEKASPKSTPWAQTLKDSIAAAATAAAAAEIKRKAVQEANHVISSAAPQWAPTLRVKGYEERTSVSASAEADAEAEVEEPMLAYTETKGYDGTAYTETKGYDGTAYADTKGYDGTAYMDEDEEEGSLTPPYR